MGSAIRPPPMPADMTSMQVAYSPGNQSLNMLCSNECSSFLTTATTRFMSYRSVRCLLPLRTRVRGTAPLGGALRKRVPPGGIQAPWRPWRLVPRAAGCRWQGFPWVESRPSSSRGRGRGAGPPSPRRTPTGRHGRRPHRGTCTRTTTRTSAWGTPSTTPTEVGVPFLDLGRGVYIWIGATTKQIILNEHASTCAKGVGTVRMQKAILFSPNV